jgi:hypothetical protein
MQRRFCLRASVLRFAFCFCLRASAGQPLRQLLHGLMHALLLAPSLQRLFVSICAFPPFRRFDFSTLSMNFCVCDSYLVHMYDVQLSADGELYLGM